MKLEMIFNDIYFGRFKPKSYIFREAKGLSSCPPPPICWRRYPLWVGKSGRWGRSWSQWRLICRPVRGGEDLSATNGRGGSLGYRQLGRCLCLLGRWSRIRGAKAGCGGLGWVGGGGLGLGRQNSLLPRILRLIRFHLSFDL